MLERKEEPVVPLCARRDSGVAFVLIIVLSAGLMILSSLSIQMSLNERVVLEVQEGDLFSRQIAESAAAQALARIREGGFEQPATGGWLPFSGGEFYYYSSFDAATETTIIRAWGRIAISGSPSGSSVAPDAADWDGTGYFLNGVEIAVQASKYIPNSPLYAGNGGFERPLQGFEWTGGFQKDDQSTWGKVSSFPSSYQYVTVDVDDHGDEVVGPVPLEVSALDHPVDYLVNGGTPTPASAYPHPYALMTSQTEFGQFNTEAWFTYSADPANGLSTVTPPPTAALYDTADRWSPDYPFPIDSSVPDVQDFAWRLWSMHKADPDTYLLDGSALSGAYGTLDDPRVTIVTGGLTVSSGQTFEGAGILVIRDDYDPNVDSNNTPSTKASMSVSGIFRWTGLVLVAGWAPSITIETGGDATIVGGLFGEDSVQSGGEVSLDSAALSLVVRDNLRVYYSSGVFNGGGLIYDLMPSIIFRVVGVRELGAKADLPSL